MNTSNKRWRLLAILAVFAMIIAACGGDGDSSTTTAAPGGSTAAPGDTQPPTDTTEPTMGGGTVHGSLGAEPTQIDPQQVSETTGFEVARLLFTGLTSYDPAGGAVIPGAAESWEPNEDNSVWTFHLHDGMLFSDGTPVTAQSFVDGFNRLADPDLASPVAYHGGPILGWGDVNGGDPSGEIGDDQVEGLAAVDDLTFQVTLEQSLSFLPKVVAHPAFSPVNPEAASAADYFDMPIGNGPYKMVEPWQHQVSISLERSDTYFGEPGLPDAVEFTIFSDPVVEYQALLDGQIDVLALGEASLIDQAKSDFASTFSEKRTGSFGYLGYPTQTAPYDSVEMRQALTMAVDREAITTQIMQNPVANGFVPPVAFGSVDGFDSCPACEYQPEAAKELFDSLGGIPGNKLTISYNAGGGHDDWIAAIANDWTNNLGIEVDFNTLEWAAYLEFLGLTGGPLATQPFRLGWIWDYPSAYNFLAPLYETGPDDYTGYSNPDFDALMEQARTAPTEEDAIPFLEEAQRILGNDLPVMPMNYGNAEYMWNDEVVSEVNYNDFGFFLWEDMSVLGG